MKIKLLFILSLVFLASSATGYAMNLTARFGGDTIYIDNHTPYKLDFGLDTAGLFIFPSINVMSQGSFEINDVLPSHSGSREVEGIVKPRGGVNMVVTGGRYASNGKIIIKDASSDVNYGIVEFKMTEGTLGVEQVLRSKKEGTGGFFNIDEVIEVTVTTEWDEDGYRIIVESSGPEDDSRYYPY